MPRILMLRNLLLVFFIVLATANCCGIKDKQPKSAEDADKASISPSPLLSENAVDEKIRMGAVWSSLRPKTVSLILVFDSRSPALNGTNDQDSYERGFAAVDIAVDGMKYSYPVGYPTDIDIISYPAGSSPLLPTRRNILAIPFSLLEKMMNAKDCRLKIYTYSGHVDILFSTEKFPDDNVTAIVFFKRFLDFKDVADD